MIIDNKATNEELMATLLTVDGRGKLVKGTAIHELIARAVAKVQREND